VTASPSDPHDTGTPTGGGATGSQDDTTFVPGFGQAAGEVPAPRSGTHLDMSQDPDRYDAARPTPPTGRLDPAHDPDRARPGAEVPPGQGQTLTELLGDGAHEQKRDNYEWAFGLIGIIAFLALVSWFFSSVVTP
jgi:hypothetical protein